MKNKELKDRIKYTCKSKGITMKELASRLGINDVSLNQSLSRDMRISRLYEISEALGVTVADLFVTTNVSIEIDGKECSVKDSIVIKLIRRSE